MSPTRDQKIGILEIASYLAAAVAVAGTIVWGWDLNLLILLLILVVTYAVLRDVRSLWILKWRDERFDPPDRTIVFQRSSSHPPARRPAAATDDRAKARSESSAGIDRKNLMAQAKGTTHEVEGISKV
jgi:hypothetical protein